MPISFSATIEAEINAVETAVIDLFVVDFGHGIFQFLSRHKVPVDYYPTTDFANGTTLVQPSEFKPKIISVGDRTWQLDHDDSSLSLEIAIDDDINKFMVQYGVRIFEGARVTMYRLLPNIKETYKMWQGIGLAPRFRQTSFTWDIQFGLGNFRRKFGRKIQLTCPHIFANGPSSDCPYAPENALGRPDLTKGIRFTAQASTSNALVVMLGDQTATVSTGWICFTPAKNVFAPVTKVALVGGNTHLTIRSVKAGEGGTATFASGDVVWVAPRHIDCPKLPPSCKDRGMFGPHDEDQTGVGDKRSYFGGTTSAPAIEFDIKLGVHTDTFTRTPTANQSLAGKIIPVIVGDFFVKQSPSLVVGAAGQFQHGFFILSEGQCVQLIAPKVNEHPPDNVDENISADVNLASEGSLHQWGFVRPSGFEDARATTINLAKAVRRAVGQRASFAPEFNRELNAYGFGATLDHRDRKVGNPYLFKTEWGDGISLSGICGARVRIETNQDLTSNLQIEGLVTGILCPLPSNFTKSLQSFGQANNAYDLVVSGTRLRYEFRPPTALFAYAMCIDPRWGIRLSEDQLDLASIKTAIEYHNGDVANPQADLTEYTGTVTFGPGDLTSSRLNNWFVTQSIDTEMVDNALQDQVVQFTTAGKQFATPISRHATVAPQKQILETELGIRIPSTVTLDATKLATVVYLRSEFPSGKNPVNGNAFTILAARNSKRWMANGKLEEDEPVGKLLAEILDESATNYRMSSDGKIEFILRKALTASELDNIVSKHLFTDHGTKRNILRDQNGTTVSWHYKSSREIPNSFSYRFLNKSDNWRATRLTVYSEEAQRRTASLDGNEGDVQVLDDEMELRLTNELGQAARRLALRIREEVFQNLFIDFKTSLKNAAAILPGDIIAVDSVALQTLLTNIDSDVKHVSGALFFRVLKKQENSDFVIQLSCQLHVNGIYDDGVKSFGELFVIKDSTKPRSGIPSHVKIESLTEELERATDGTIRDFVKIKITYPTFS